MKTAKNYSGDKIKGLEDFLNLCEDFEYQDIFETDNSDYENPISERMPLKVKRKILELQKTKDKESPYFLKYKEILSRLKDTPFMMRRNESEIVTFINKLLSNNHLPDVDLDCIVSLEELTERQAFTIITTVFKSVLLWVDDKPLTQKKYLDLDQDTFKYVENRISKKELQELLKIKQ
ncbi:hypothetical protein ACQ9ZH_20945 [Pseudomonas chlororaphis]